MEAQSPPPGTKGFSAVRIRRVVERTNAWNCRSRRNSKDYERTTASTAAMIKWSAIHLMLKRLAPVDPPVCFKYKLAVNANPTALAAGRDSRFSDSLSAPSNVPESFRRHPHVLTLAITKPPHVLRQVMIAAQALRVTPVTPITATASIR